MNKATYLEPTRKSPNQVLVGAPNWWGASTITERALNQFLEKDFGDLVNPCGNGLSYCSNTIVG